LYGQIGTSYYLPYLFLTLAIEAPLVFGLLVRRAGWRRALLAAFLPSLVSHPLLWFVWRRVVGHYWWYVLSGELLVVLLEAGIFLGLALRPRSDDDDRVSPATTALALSFVVNFVSWGVGMLLSAVGLLHPIVFGMARGVSWLLGDGALP